MSLLLNLNTTQATIFKKVMKAAKVKNLEYEAHGVQLTSDNFDPIADALREAWLKAILQEENDDAEALRAITSRLSGFEYHFECGAFEKIKAGLEDALEIAENKEAWGDFEVGLERLEPYEDIDDLEEVLETPNEEVNNDNA